MLKITVVKEEHLRKEIPKVGVVYEQKAYVYLDDEPFPKEIRVSKSKVSPFFPSKLYKQLK